MKEILIRMPNWIGDSVMAVGLLRFLSREYKIYLVGKPWLAELFYGEGFFKGIFPFRHLFSCASVKNEGILLPNSFSSALNFKVCGVKRIIGYPKDFRGFLLTDKVEWRREHQVLQYFRLGEYVLGYEGEPVVELKPLKEEKDIDVVFIPGGSKSSKRWPASHFRTLGKMLKERRASVLYVGSEKEKELLKEAAGDLSYSTPSVLGLREVLSRARLVVGNDTGPIHLADAMGVEVLVIFGPSTDPELTAPWNQRGNYIRKNDMYSITPEEVFEKIKDTL